MKRKFNFKWMLPALGTIVFLSCGSENEYEMPTKKNEQTATLKLEITGEFPSDKTSDQTRALSFNTALNIPSFINEDGVTSWKTHCFLRKAGTTTQVYALIDWTATTAADGSITLNTKTSELTLLSSGSSTVTTPQAGETWYIAGIAGDGNLNADRTKVDFKYDATKDDALEAHQARVPLSFGWTPFVVAAASGERAPKITVTFRPQGSLLKVTVNNTTAVNSGQFGVSGPITVTTNALTTDGAFDYTPSTTTVVEGANPTFSFASATAVEEVITRNATVSANASKAYVLWGYPRPADHLASGSSFSTVTTIPPYRTYNSTAKTAAVTRTRAYANAIGYPTTVYVERPILPIEYMTEYNLAGGTDFMVIPTNSSDSKGTSGSLRFSNRSADGSIESAPYANNLSGYYSWNLAMGTSSGVKLEDQNLIDTDGATIVLKSKYRLPDADDHWNIFPTDNTSFQHSTTIDRTEYGKTTDGTRQTYRSQYSRVYTGVPTTNDVTMYAIRQQKALSGDTERTFTTNEGSVWNYPKATTDAMACAYRYVRRGAFSADNLTEHLTVDVVYLGAGSSETLETLAQKNESFWTSGISRTFPATGYVSASNTLSMRGKGGAMLATTRRSSSTTGTTTNVLGFHFYVNVCQVYQSHHEDTGLILRLFKNSVE